MKNNQQKSKHGGKREGAGRKPGQVSEASRAIRALASQHCQSAFDTLIDVMTNEDTPPASRIAAAKEVLERGYGRPGNYLSLETDVQLSELDTKEALSLICDHASTGQISMEDSARLTGLIEARMRAVDMAELDDRIAKLEANK